MLGSGKRSLNHELWGTVTLLGPVWNMLNLTFGICTIGFCSCEPIHTLFGWFVIVTNGHYESLSHATIFIQVSLRLVIMDGDIPTPLCSFHGTTMSTLYNGPMVGSRKSPRSFCELHASLLDLTPYPHSPTTKRL